MLSYISFNEFLKGTRACGRRENPLVLRNGPRQLADANLLVLSLSFRGYPCFVSLYFELLG